MRKFFYTLAVVLFMTLFIQSCKKNKDEPGNVNTRPVAVGLRMTGVQVTNTPVGTINTLYDDPNVTDTANLDFKFPDIVFQISDSGGNLVYASNIRHNVDPDSPEGAWFDVVDTAINQLDSIYSVQIIEADSGFLTTNYTYIGSPIHFTPAEFLSASSPVSKTVVMSSADIHVKFYFEPLYP